MGFFGTKFELWFLSSCVVKAALICLGKRGSAKYGSGVIQYDSEN